VLDFWVFMADFLTGRLVRGELTCLGLSFGA
jgi:hypothetical protein